MSFLAVVRVRVQRRAVLLWMKVVIFTSAWLDDVRNGCHMEWTSASVGPAGDTREYRFGRGLGGTSSRMGAVSGAG